MARFLYRILPPRADFVATIAPEEQAVMAAHFAYLQGLHAQGRVYFAGRAENGDFGIVVFEAEDMAAAQAVARADPAVAGGLMRVELHAFRIATLD